MSFLLESSKVCQRYFYFSLQTRFGLVATPENYQKSGRDPRWHRLQKTQSFSNPGHARCRGNVREANRHSLGAAWQSRSATRRGSLATEACHYRGIRIQLRTNPRAVNCKYEFTKKHAAGIGRSRLRDELSILPLPPKGDAAAFPAAAASA